MAVRVNAVQLALMNLLFLVDFSTTVQSRIVELGLLSLTFRFLLDVFALFPSHPTSPPPKKKSFRIPLCFWYCLSSFSLSLSLSFCLFVLFFSDPTYNYTHLCIILNYVKFCLTILCHKGYAIKHIYFVFF